MRVRQLVPSRAAAGFDQCLRQQAGADDPAPVGVVSLAGQRDDLAGGPESGSSGHVRGLVDGVGIAGEQRLHIRPPKAT